MEMSARSIFNDVLGPVTAGPSSSHCAGCARIGLAVRRLWGREIRKADVVYDLRGSYPATHEGQGSDMGFAAGLLGLETSDPRMKESLSVAEERGMELAFRFERLSFGHPNEARVDVYGESGSVELSVLCHSTGGGSFRLTEINGLPVFFDGGRDLVFRDASGTEWRCEALLPVALRDTEPAFFDAASALEYEGGRGTGLAGLALIYETSVGKVTEEEVRALAQKTLAVMKASVIPPKMSAARFGFRPFTAARMAEKASRAGLISSGCLEKAMIYAVSAMENSCARNIIAAAPTAGSCGVIPGALLAAGESLGLADEELADCLLACGMAGAVIANRATFAAESAGCQAETGAASAMAAAGLAQMMGGSASQGFAAASLALQNSLGLICDPVGGFTEIPCIGRNVSAAANALTAANMVMAGFDPMIPFDEAADTMLRVGAQLPPSLRCTCGGGLCETEAAKLLVKNN